MGSTFLVWFIVGLIVYYFYKRSQNSTSTNRTSQNRRKNNSNKWYNKNHQKENLTYKTKGDLFEVTTIRKLLKILSK